ncbi:MAG: NAD(P)H-dependent oxidoreductase [Anaerolineaceae bacterium]|nr:NAD(P)H-dependent oxidoreductase [Anaerolineaceae bacterium]
MAKKILAFVFSGRKNGNSHILMNEILRPCRERGFEIELIRPTKLNIRPCTGCFGCNNGELKCIIKDDLEMLKEKIKTADAIVLTAPCYIFSAPGLMKDIMDRSAAWALDLIENGQKPKIGISVSVAGATPEWFSLQKIFTSLFLKLYNCNVVYQKVFGGVALKGEVLLHPDILDEMNCIGKELAKNLTNEKPLFAAISEISEKHVCKNCRSDVFTITDHGKIICAVCGRTIEKKGFLKRYHLNDGFDKFSPLGAKQHSEYIGGKIVGGMAAAEEIKHRLYTYVQDGTLPKMGFQTSPISSAVIDIRWEEEALNEFTRLVPRGFQKFVKQAINKKAAQAGYSQITKDIFLKIKKESGN